MIPPLSLRRGDAFSIKQLATHLFVHGDPLHLLGNMIFLFVFGNAVTAKLGQFWFLLCYLCLGILAGLAWLALGQGPAALGASGAIMGLVGLFLIFFPRNDVQVFYWFLYIRPGTFCISSAWVIMFYVVGDLFGTIFDSSGGVAYIAHLAGTAAGVAMGIGLLKLGLVESADDEQNLLQVLGWHKKRRRRAKLRMPPIRTRKPRS